MFVILIIISTAASTNALEQLTNIELGDDNVREVISKYMEKIPDIPEQYVADQRLSRAISHYFKGKISAFPLFKVSVKIDRNPIKIPWTLGDQDAALVKQFRAQVNKNQKKEDKKRYKYIKLYAESGTSKLNTDEITPVELPKVNSSPLYNISVEIERNPVKTLIPMEPNLGQVKKKHIQVKKIPKKKQVKKREKYTKQTETTRTSQKPSDEPVGTTLGLPNLTTVEP